MIWKSLFGVIGLASLFYILHGYGFAQLGLDINHLGWWAVPLALSFFPTVVCYASAWLLVTPELGLVRLPAMVRFSAISVAWNNLSPFVKALGEPVRAQMIAGWVSPRAAAKSVVIYNLVHTIGTLGSFFLGSLLLLLFFPVDGVIRTGLFVFLVAAPTLIAGLFSFPYLSKKLLGRRVNRSRLAIAGFWVRWSFSKMRTFARHNPARFWAAAGVEVAARFVEGSTFYVSFHALGKPVPAFTCGLLDIGRALMDNIFFFVPYQVGSREGGIVLLAKHAVGVAAGVAVSAAVFYRLVELFWMGAGYTLWIIEARSRRSSR